MTDEFSVESVYAELLGRAPENKMEPRLAPLHRAMDILGEPNKAFPISTSPAPTARPPRHG